MIITSFMTKFKKIVRLLFGTDKLPKQSPRLIPVRHYTVNTVKSIAF